MKNVLKFKLSTIVPVVLFLFVISLSLFFWKHQVFVQEEAAEQANVEFVNSLLNRLQATIENSILQEDYDSVRSEIANLGAYQDVDCAFLIDDHKKVVYSAVKAIVNRQVEDILSLVQEDKAVFLRRILEVGNSGKGAVYLSRDRDKIFGYCPVVLVFQPQEYKSAHIGFLFLQYDLKIIKNNLHYAVEQQAKVYVFIIFVFSIVLWVLIYFILTHRIMNLIDVGKRFAEGDMSVRVRTRMQDEVGTLGQTFNWMAEKISTNIKEIKAAELQMNIERDRSKKYLDIAAMIIVVIGIDEKISLINARGCEILGYSEKEVIGKNWFDIFVPESHRKNSRIIFERFLNKENGLFGYNESFIVTKDNKERLIAWNSVILQDETGFINGMLRSGEDITERRLAEEAIRDSEIRFSAIFENDPTGIIIINVKTRVIQEVNNAALEMLGCSKAYVIGKVCHGFFCPAEKNRCPIIDLGQVVDRSERVMLKADGTRINILKTVAPIKINGEDCLLESFIDITDRKKAEEALKKAYEDLETKVEERTKELSLANKELRSASQVKSEFLASMSHELRTPLNAVIGFSEVLYDETFGALNAKQKEYLNDVLGCGKHLLSLINDILDLSKVEAGKVELSLSVFGLEGLFQDCFVLISTKAAKQNIVLKKDVPAEIGDIKADVRKMKQILFNLLSNAVKFTPAGGEIGMNARKTDGEIEVTVWDTGIGIASEHHEKIFEEFFQIENVYTKAYQGTGLGLTLAKKLVELHGGKIWVESEGLGKGSAFKFTIPF